VIHADRARCIKQRRICIHEPHSSESEPESNAKFDCGITPWDRMLAVAAAGAEEDPA
jgi:hypothetical protein